MPQLSLAEGLERQNKPECILLWRSRSDGFLKDFVHILQGLAKMGLSAWYVWSSSFPEGMSSNNISSDTCIGFFGSCSGKIMDVSTLASKLCTGLEKMRNYFLYQCSMNQKENNYLRLGRWILSRFSLSLLGLCDGMLLPWNFPMWEFRFPTFLKEQGHFLHSNSEASVDWKLACTRWICVLRLPETYKLQLMQWSYHE